jgi:hypothetical protein
MSVSRVSGQWSPNGPPRGSRLLVQLVACTLGIVLTSGCYVYRPIQGMPSSGMQVALELNDRGRVALSDSVGPSADRIEGEVQSIADSVLVVRVASIRYTNGATHRWTSEPLSIRADLLRDLQEKRFSRTRTWAVAGASTAMLLILAISVDLLGFGSEGPGGGGGGGPDQ